MLDKTTTMREAIAHFVSDGTALALGMALESLIPFAAAHEIVRQQKRNLSLIGPISDMLFDQLIGAGCARRVVAAWVRGDLDQAAPGGGADRADAVSARVGRLVKLLAGETLAVR